jgi:hypothetical protein
MKRTLIKYPPEAPELCEYEVISAKWWHNAETHREIRENYRPAAGPYFDGEGWMLNAALAAYKNCNVVLVEEICLRGQQKERRGITVYRAAKELVEVPEEP